MAKRNIKKAQSDSKIKDTKKAGGTQKAVVNELKSIVKHLKAEIKGLKKKFQKDLSEAKMIGHQAGILHGYQAAEKIAHAKTAYLAKASAAFDKKHTKKAVSASVKSKKAKRSVKAKKIKNSTQKSKKVNTAVAES